MDAIETVVFRTWRNTALFPQIATDKYGHHCQSYELIGEHGGADYQGVISQTRPATKEEYADTMAALVRRGYSLKVVKRSSFSLSDRLKYTFDSK